MRSLKIQIVIIAHSGETNIGGVADFEWVDKIVTNSDKQGNFVEDINGNDFVNLIIMLKEKENVLAKTALTFRPFPNQKKGHHLKVVK